MRHVRIRGGSVEYNICVVSGEGLAPIVSAYSRLIFVDGTVL